MTWIAGGVLTPQLHKVDGAATMTFNGVRYWRSSTSTPTLPDLRGRDFRQAQARAELDNAPAPGALTDAEVYAMIDSLGDVAGALSGKHPDKLAALYEELRLDIRYDNEKEAIDVMASPRVNSECVRGGIRTRTAVIFPRIGEVIPEILLHVPTWFHCGVVCMGIRSSRRRVSTVEFERGLCLPAWLGYSYH